MCAGDSGGRTGLDHRRTAAEAEIQDQNHEAGAAGTRTPSRAGIPAALLSEASAGAPFRHAGRSVRLLAELNGFDEWKLENDFIEIVPDHDMGCGPVDRSFELGVHEAVGHGSCDLPGLIGVPEVLP